ncbi:MAG: ferrous iron transport protein B [Victivallaceae bacterium]
MYRIAVAGNPNSGKTCLFNYLTGSSQRVGNYAGVTVEFVAGDCNLCGEKSKMIDLPGIYSLTAYSQEELVARDYIVNEQPDVIINVVDASNLERNLYLTAQLLELNVPIVIALNMMDVAEKKGVSINANLLAQILGIEVVETVACKRLGLDKLKQACLKTIKEKILPKSVDYSHELRLVLPDLEEAINGNTALCGRFPVRWTAIKLLEGDEIILDRLKHNPECEKIDHMLSLAQKKLLAHSNEDTATAIAEARYGFASGAARKVTLLSEMSRRMLTETIDKFVCNRLLGPIILCAVVFALFAMVFQISQSLTWLPLFNGKWVSPVGMMELIFDSLSNATGKYISAPWLQSMICDGVIGGVGGIMSFVPLIFFMFFFIAALEDSGYVARIAFIMDRILRTFGLQGKSILAMIVSGGLGAGGCAVPGVMATRTLREEKDRLVTIMVAPFMNCAAKMPVYAMLIGAFFTQAKGSMMFLLWLMSWGFALGSAWLLRRFVIRGEQTPFVMELPVYHLPTLQGVLMDTWNRTYLFIKKATTIILAVNLIMWALMYYPRFDSAHIKETMSKNSQQLEKVAKNSIFAPVLTGDEREHTERAGSDISDANHQLGALRKKLKVALDGKASGLTENDRHTVVAWQNYLHEQQRLKNELAYNQLQNSFAGKIGLALTPLSELAGFGLRENIALIGGLAAKEVVLGTMGTAYSMGRNSDNDNSESIGQILTEDSNWNRLRAFVLLVFVMVYAPCLMTLAAIKKETGKWRWAVFSATYSTALAFVAAVVIYQIGNLF